MKAAFHEQLAIAAKKTGKRRVALAIEMGITKGHLSDVLNGKKQVTLDTLKLLIKVLRPNRATSKEWARLAAKAAGWDV